MKYHSPPKRQNSPKINITFSYVTTPQRINKENCQPSNRILQPIQHSNSINDKVSLKNIKFKCIKCGKTIQDDIINQSQPKCNKCKQKNNISDKVNFSRIPRSKVFPDVKKNLTHNSKTKVLAAGQKEFQLQHFLKEVQKQYTLTKGKLQELKIQQQALKTIFNEKRSYLKTHYEKIKIALEEAMFKDFHALQQSQNEELAIIKEDQVALKRDLAKLQGIKEDIQPNIQKIIEKVEQSRYNDFLSKYRKEVNRIASINLSKISNRLTLTASIEDKQSFYDSSLFRIIQGHQQAHSRNESFVMSANSGIFFSFQKKKL